MTGTSYNQPGIPLSLHSCQTMVMLVSKEHRVIRDACTTDHANLVLASGCEWNGPVLMVCYLKNWKL